jgi:5-methyltetrahydrofolate--homocysteine methyltransferase
MNDIIDQIFDAVVDGQLEEAMAGLESGLAEKLPVSELLNDGLIAAMAEVGRLFEAGEYFVPEMLMSARAMKGCMERLRPLLAESGVEPIGRVVIGTVTGDLHDIGKNLVSMMLEGAGFQVFDLGVDVRPNQFVDKIREVKPEVVGMSALLTTTMPQMVRTIQAIEEAGLREQVKIIVGGAPVTAQYAETIGADGYAPDAGRAAALARSLLGR